MARLWSSGSSERDRLRVTERNPPPPSSRSRWRSGKHGVKALEPSERLFDGNAAPLSTSERLPERNAVGTGVGSAQMCRRRPGMASHLACPDISTSQRTRRRWQEHQHLTRLVIGLPSLWTAAPPRSPPRDKRNTAGVPGGVPPPPPAALGVTSPLYLRPSLTRARRGGGVELKHPS